MIVFANNITSRLRYIFDFIGKETIGEAFSLTSDVESFRQYQGPKINYSKEKITSSEFWIRNSELLFESGIKEQNINCFETGNYKAFFKTDGDLPFDIFAASFYLLSRYEEYLPHQKDMYGRYAYENSLAYKENFLHLPLINIWIEDLKRCLKIKFPQLTTHHSLFTFLPAYDIDEAYSYKHKQWWRTIGGFVKSVGKGQWSMIIERLNVLRGTSKDPYDAFEWMNELHKQYDLKPIYFFLIAGKTRKYDKNILPSEKAMQDLINEHSRQYSVGIHPSWQSGDDIKKLNREISRLSQITDKPIRSSRQHYIRLTLPGTYRQLINAGIRSDFSMGYGSINGFRASVALPFYWYDLEKEKQTQLMLCPFCFMDANSFYEQKFSPEQALDEMRHYYKVVKSVNGVMSTIWHNSFLGSDKTFEGWKEVYKEFISSVKD